jgi:hypothetical protein
MPLTLRPPLVLNEDRLNDLKMAWKQADLCMRDGNGKGKYKGPAYMLLATTYAKQRLNAYFNMLEMLMPKEVKQLPKPKEDA